MTTIGYMNIIPVETNVLEGSLHIEWKIFNFTSYSDEDGRNYFSPIFTFADERWNLEIYPNGRQKVDSSGYICLYLVKKSSGPSVILEYSLGLKTLNGKKFVEHYRTHKFKRINQAGGVHKCILRSDLLKRSDFLPIDHLTVFCHLKYPKSAVNASK